MKICMPRIEYGVKLENQWLYVEDMEDELEEDSEEEMEEEIILGGVGSDAETDSEDSDKEQEQEEADSEMEQAEEVEQAVHPARSRYSGRVI